MSEALGWRERPEPLPPRAALGLGAVAARLGARLERASDEELARLEGAAGAGALVVLGEASALPWVEGVIYLGRDPRAPGLLLPTALEPTVHPALLERAARRREAPDGASVALLPEPARQIVVAAPRRLERRLLAALLREGGRQ